MNENELRSNLPPGLLFCVYTGNYSQATLNFVDTITEAPPLNSSDWTMEKEVFHLDIDVTANDG